MPIVISFPAPATDANTLLLVHSDTTNGSTTFVDSSEDANIPSTNGVVIEHSTDFAKFGATSIKFDDGVLNFINSPAANTFRFNTGDFTLDFWMLRDGNMGGSTAVPSKIITLSGFNPQEGPAIGLDTGTSIRCGFTDQYANNWLKSGISITDQTWTHIAFVRESLVGYVFKDGVLEGTSFAFTQDLDDAGSQLSLGGIHANSNTPRLTNTYLDEVRVSDTARWTSNFTPPTAPYSA